MSARIECDTCGKEAKQVICGSCAADQLEDHTVECQYCKSPADVCEACGGGGLAERTKEYADRRKMLGLMSPEVYREFELFIDDLEAVHG